MLEIQNLTYAYSRRRPPVLDKVNLNIGQGGVYGLLGPNGAGKSTLLYLIMGALLPQSGTVCYQGVPTRQRRPDILGQMMIVPEEIKLPGMTVEKYGACMGRFWPLFSNEVFGDCLEVFEIDRRMNLGSMSMGQKKKAYMSFALGCQTPLLLMDEPTNGLDIPGKAAFRRLVARLMTDDRIVVISTHQVRDLDQLLDHVVVMDTHRVVFSEPVSSIQQHLKFVSNASGRVPEGVLWSQPSPGGCDIMLPNHEEEDTAVNLELLFEYALRFPDNLNRIFTHQVPPLPGVH